jgi:hypothetical protein
MGHMSPRTYTTAHFSQRRLIGKTGRQKHKKEVLFGEREREREEQENYLT